MGNGKGERGDEEIVEKMKRKKMKRGGGERHDGTTS